MGEAVAPPESPSGPPRRWPPSASCSPPPRAPRPATGPPRRPRPWCRPRAPRRRRPGRTNDHRRTDHRPSRRPPRRTLLGSRCSTGSCSPTTTRASSSGARIALRDRTARSPRPPPARRPSTRRAGRSIPTWRGTSGASPRPSSPSSCSSSPQEGRIDLDAGIQRYLPDLPGADRITPRQLLQHTSGLAEYDDKPAVLNDAQRPWTPAELIAVAEAAGRVGEPGAAYHYSNTNYIVLGEIIQQVTGHPWADEVRTRIVEPLGLTNTRMMSADSAPGFIVDDGSFVDATTICGRVDRRLGRGAAVDRPRPADASPPRWPTGPSCRPSRRRRCGPSSPARTTRSSASSTATASAWRSTRTAPSRSSATWGPAPTHSAFLGYDPADGTAVAVMTNTANPGPQAFMAVEALTAANNPG